MTPNTEATSEHITVLPDSTRSTATPHGRVQVPLTMPVEQVYYWSASWQRAEAESLSDYAEGRYVETDDADALIRWLDEPDESDSDDEQ